MRSQNLIGASRVFVCDEGFCVIKDGGVLYESIECDETSGHKKHSQEAKILAVGKYEDLVREYPSAEREFWHDSVLLPSLVNAHIHFEFSNNTTSFVYGDFGRWLDSVIAKRDDVLSDITKSVQEAIALQFANGVGLVGAISSYGYDMETLSGSGLRVVYFSEAMGSNPGAIDALFSDFKARLGQSIAHKSELFTPAVALHSPYSLHHIYAKYVLQEAKNLKTPISAHFLESTYEREWLMNGSGYFYDFFSRTFKVPNPKPFYSIEGFLEQFVDFDNVLLTHCLFAGKSEYKIMAQNAYNIVTCPRSNRLLNNTYLSFLHMQGRKDSDFVPNIALGTDGRSSNADVSLLEEMRSMLFACPQVELDSLAQQILKMATCNGAQALGVKSGILKDGYNADIAVFEIPHITHSCQEALQFILHAKEAKRLLINGKGII
ncbi:MAG TPA: metal-dependent hydrolase [Candidatus Helicobacter avicola]|nr:metal-dependent hydrolase [Candidatus Helicobacter avicola]